MGGPEKFSEPSYEELANILPKPGTIITHIADGGTYSFGALARDASGFEQGEPVSVGPVIYTQLYDDEYPAGTVWTRKDVPEFFAEFTWGKPDPE